MEDGLVHTYDDDLKDAVDVLILVVMEDGLVLDTKHFRCEGHGCLNPCCNGRWSRTSQTTNVQSTANRVLILVVMEDGLVQIRGALYH